MNDVPTLALPNGGVNDDHLAEGSSFAGYVVREQIGDGGFAQVYLAEHGDGSRVALKVLRRHLACDPHFRQRFLAEIRTLQTLQHPNIVEILDFGLSTDSSPYLVMELLSGITVSRLIASKGRLEPLEAVEILRPVCAALELVHERGIVHRDVKAANIMVVDNPARTIKLLDFGIAKALTLDQSDPRLTTTGVKIGSSNVMAPEQIRCQPVDARTDVYALGVLLYRLLVGVEPFQGDRIDIERLHLNSPPPRPSAHARLAASIDDVVLRCMEKEPVQRYPSVGAVLEAFLAATGSNVCTTTQHRTALVLCVRTNDVDPDDEVAQEEALGALETIEGELHEAGIPIVVDTGNGFVAVKLLGEDESGRGRECAAVVALIRELYPQLSRQAENVPIRIDLHVDRVITRQSEHGQERVELIANNRDWMEPDAAGVSVSASCRAVLTPEQIEQLVVLGSARG